MTMENLMLLQNRFHRELTNLVASTSISSVLSELADICSAESEHLHACGVQRQKIKPWDTTSFFLGEIARKVASMTEDPDPQPPDGGADMMTITRNIDSTRKSTASTASAPYKLRKDAADAAVRKLGPESRDGFEFTVIKCDGGWIWRPTDPEAALRKAATNAAQLKANGGKRSVLAMVAGIEGKGGTVSDAMLERAATVIVACPPGSVAVLEKSDPLVDQAASALAKDIAQAAAANVADKIDTTEDKNGTPQFLKRSPMSKEQKDDLVKKTKKTVGPSRVIKSPPDAKKTAGKTPKTGGKKQTKTALVGQLLLSKRGCTTADILKATGWPSVSVPRQAKVVGLGLRKQKDGKVTRYFGVPKK